jgi:hypothetical protein
VNRRFLDVAVETVTVTVTEARFAAEVATAPVASK